MKGNKHFQNIDEVKNTLDIIINWINNCDTKSSIMLGIIGVILGILLSFDYVSIIYEVTIKLYSESNLCSYVFMFLILSSIITILLGIIFLIRSLLAKTNLAGIKDKGLIRDSVLFFSCIAKNKDFNSYKHKILSYSDEGWLHDYISQIYICSIICERKFSYYKKGLLCSCIGIVILFLLISINYIKFFLILR